MLGCDRRTFRSQGKYVGTLNGNELAMQNGINLSIHAPKDDGGLIGFHADMFAGETPFQAVLWVPLTSVSGTESMDILPPSKNMDLATMLKKKADAGAHVLFEMCEQHVRAAEC